MKLEGVQFPLAVEEQ